MAEACHQSGRVCNSHGFVFLSKEKARATPHIETLYTEFSCGLQISPEKCSRDQKQRCQDLNNAKSGVRSSSVDSFGAHAPSRRWCIDASEIVALCVQTTVPEQIEDTLYRPPRRVRQSRDPLVGLAMQLQPQNLHPPLYGRVGMMKPIVTHCLPMFLR